MAPLKTIAFRLSLGILAAALLGLAAIGTVTALGWCRAYWARVHAPAPAALAAAPVERIPCSKLPGPARASDPRRYVLSATNAQLMVGIDDRVNERWCDVSGNFYAASFISDFNYTGGGRINPQVLVRIEPRADTLRGLIEAHRLKPNFAYQVKLRGIFADRRSFETIGRIGRWRLPGVGTNYQDQDYLDYPDKASVESYILFDYFVTDRRGNAIRNLALDSSLHVLWNASRQGGEPEMGDLVQTVVLANDPAFYGRPKPAARVEWLWAERESIRYRHANEQIRLPPGDYMAELVLTEESFHSRDSDGGFWATVLRCPIAFTVVR